MRDVCDWMTAKKIQKLGTFDSCFGAEPEPGFQ